jgi:hypothetical protein
MAKIVYHPLGSPEYYDSLRRWPDPIWLDLFLDNERICSISFRWGPALASGQRSAASGAESASSSEGEESSNPFRSAHKG